MSIDFAAITPSSSPSTTSVEPPPMSTTRIGRAASAGTLLIAPAKATAASSSPVSTSGSTPSRASTPARNSAALLASRVADVAQNLICSTRCS